MVAVEMRNITKRFGTLLANDGIDFTLRQQEIHALLGENGAGKTTLMRILYGLYHADEGDIHVSGQPVQIRSPRDAIDHGIGMVTQHFALVLPLTVTENVVLGYTEEFSPDDLIFETGDDERARAEILGGIDRLHEVLGDRPTSFAYPNGRPGRDFAPTAA